MPTEPGKPDYTMFSLDGNYVAGGSPAFVPDMPSFWNSYVSVDNVDEMASKVEKLGGKVTMPPMDVLDAGRMVGIEDPTGANVMLWQPKKHIGAGIVNTVGAMCWNELYTRDIEKAKQFYADLLGWTYDVDEKSGYVGIRNNGRSNGGMMAITPEMGQMQAKWMVYFTVRNLDESVTNVKELGGVVYMPNKDISVGKIGIVADPAGASIVLIELSVLPTEWVE